jgi:pimeloyl-ACP methyl ester carboxylesterase
MTPATDEFLTVRGVRLHMRRWGRPDAPLLVMVHGWLDVGASFQFVVDALAGDWQVVAPDARGFGLSDWPVQAQGGGYYWFPDYLADLDAILDHYSPDAPVNLVGHSMGGNVVCLYAGVRPGRVRRVVDLEGFGLAPGLVSTAPARYAGWLDQLRVPQTLSAYDTLDLVAARLRKNNPRLTAPRAAFLAGHWSRQRADGRYELLADPAHKINGPLIYKLDETLAIWAQATAPVLHIEGADSTTLNGLAQGLEAAEFKARFGAFADWRQETIADAGHMLHHDQPEKVAALTEAFCAPDGAALAPVCPLPVAQRV